LIGFTRTVTFSDRYLSFFSNHPRCHKTGIINILVDRAVFLSHPMFYEKNLKLVINLLLNNGYPLKLIFEIINRRLKNIFVNKPRKSSMSLSDRNKNDTDTKRTSLSLHTKNRFPKRSLHCQKSDITVGCPMSKQIKRFY